jgi:hydroxyacid-oxoacid transhydrogenase
MTKCAWSLRIARKFSLQFSRVRHANSNRVKDAIAFAKPYNPDAFLAVGGGSVIDTAKLMNLYTVFPEADFLDFVNAPLGKGLPVTKALRPLVAVPTTAGTGSETTGTAIFDLVSKKAKTGIAHRNLKPTLGICDPLNTRTMPSAVHASSGLDVLCHSLESWTAIPYNERTPRPTNPINRPAYQGANPISDIFSLQALRSTVKYLPAPSATQTTSRPSPRCSWPPPWPALVSVMPASIYVMA